MKHHATEVRDLLDQAGIGLLYLPRYSPEFNPIEQAWAKMKEPLKAKAPRTLEALEAELKPALDTITAHRCVRPDSGVALESLRHAEGARQWHAAQTADRQAAQGSYVPKLDGRADLSPIPLAMIHPLPRAT
jgi:hypothetical protein